MLVATDVAARGIGKLFFQCTSCGGRVWKNRLPKKVSKLPFFSFFAQKCHFHVNFYKKNDKKDRQVKKCGMVQFCTWGGTPLPMYAFCLLKKLRLIIFIVYEYKRSKFFQMWSMLRM
jgi:hypothetical protein